MLLASSMIACGVALATTPVHPNIWVQPASAQEAAADVPEILWLETEPDAWTHPPVAHLHEGPDDPNVVIWVAMTQQQLLLHIVAIDKHHANDQSADAIWNGDAIQVAIDPKGEGKTRERQDAQLMPSGGLDATFALTQHGVRGWAHRRAAPDTPGPLVTPTRIERDEGRRTTTYDVALAWALLRCTPGESATLGLQVRVNDRDAEGVTRHVSFGDSPDGTFDAQRFATLRVGGPTRPMLALAPQRLDVWRPMDAACVMVVSNLPTALRADVHFADAHPSLHWSSPSGELRRWQVCVAPRQLLENPVAWSVAVTAQDQAATTRGTFVVASPTLHVEADLSTIGGMARSATSALARRHLEATHALLQGVWAAALTTLDDGDAAARHAADAIALTRSRLPPRAEALERSLQRGERPLLATFLSSADQSLQPYTLTVPRVLDANQAQPALLFLHGKGDPRLGQFIADAQLSHERPWEDTYLIAPWARGNLAYRDFAETDVMDAWAHANSLFHFDRERAYLGGFSMGGAGAWQVAMHQPDRWAAVAIFAGRPDGVPTGLGFGGNLAHVPVYLYHGTQDSAADVGDTLAMQDELEKNGGKPTVLLEAGVGHGVAEPQLQALRRWLAPLVRPRPTVVHYVSDRAGQSAYGITLRHDPRLGAFPRFVAHRDGQQLRLDTHGTTGVEIDLRQRVWDFNGPCRVVWNGTQMYDGPPKVLRLGQGVADAPANMRSQNH